jgi:UDP-N-acetylglucosamine 2-epimerase (non-hydrolysing)
MKKILVVVGTRPNFIKVALFKSMAAQHGFDLRIVHTGQHYDPAMADVFFRQLMIQPDYFLEIPTLAPEQQVIMIQARLNRLMGSTFTPDLVMVVGDVNSTRAAAEAAHILNIPIAHVESGLRSFDQSMPEEINRIVADNLASLFFITEQSGIDNLTDEGKPTAHMHFVGNTMIDTLVTFADRIRESEILSAHQLEEKKYFLVTLHRPVNVDDRAGLINAIQCLRWLAEDLPVVFPLHPRTLKQLETFDLYQELQHPNIHLLPPLDYFSFQKLIQAAKAVITDSGGIQEEATFYGVPCLTMRPNTERPVTVDIGSNTLVENTIQSLQPHILAIRTGHYKDAAIPALWDGKATERIFQILSALR